MNRLLSVIIASWLAVAGVWAQAEEVRYYPVPPGAGPHDVAPAPDGTVWYTAQRAGVLGRLDPASGKTEQIALGPGSSPHGVIVGPDGAAWVTDGGQNAIVRVDAKTRAVKVFPLPADAPNVNLNTAAFDRSGILWYTGQSGYYGSLNPATGAVKLWRAPRGRGPTPSSALGSSFAVRPSTPPTSARR
jgi:virginiamycin B lyase